MAAAARLRAVTSGSLVIIVMAISFNTQVVIRGPYAAPVVIKGIYSYSRFSSKFLCC